MSDLAPIKKDDEICNILTCLPDKFIVDFANGIDVVKDHLRVQRERAGFFDRLYDGFTGKGVRRQTEINASLADGVDGAFRWLNELTESLATTNFAIVEVSKRVDSIQKNVTKIAHYSADTREQLQLLSQHLGKRCDQLNSEIYRVDFEQRAERQLGQVMNKWQAGRFNTFSFSGRCYAALEELRWGVFGDYCRGNNTPTRQEFLNDMENQMIVQLAKDAQVELTRRQDIHVWLKQPAGRNVLIDAADALAYLGDASNPEASPFIYSTTQRPQDLPDSLPKLCNAERIAKAMVAELFDGES